MNATELKVEMIRHNDNDSTLAEFLGITRPSVSLKKSNKIPFRTEEIKMIANRYNLSPERVVEIFLS